MQSLCKIFVKPPIHREIFILLPFYNHVTSTAFIMLNQDAEAALQTIAAKKEVNQVERDIESLCKRLLFQQQPVAKDLRFISSALKMMTDMERIGDQAADTAEWVEYALTGRHKGVLLI